jgi:predicted lipoprotein
MNGRLIRGFCAFLLMAVVFWLFPPFHIVRINSGPAEQPAAFNPTAFATDFWQTKLSPACERAPRLSDLLQRLGQDPAGARKQFGHSPGLGSTTLFLVRGSGRVAGVDKEEIRVQGEATPNTKITLMTGLIFGNAVRDATGLIDGSAFPNSQEFNEISTELNRLVETQVLPGLRERAAAGKEIRFAGCFELEDGPLPEVIQIVPLKVEWP